MLFSFRKLYYEFFPSKGGARDVRYAGNTSDFIKKKFVFVSAFTECFPSRFRTEALNGR